MPFANRFRRLLRAQRRTVGSFADLDETCTLLAKWTFLIPKEPAVPPDHSCSSSAGGGGAAGGAGIAPVPSLPGASAFAAGAGGGEGCSCEPGAAAAAGFSAVVALGRGRGGAGSVGRALVFAWTEPGCAFGSTTTRVPTLTRP